MEARPVESETIDNRINIIDSNIPDSIEIQEHLEASEQTLDDRHQTNHGDQQDGVNDEGGGRDDGDGDVDGEGAGGGQVEHEVEEELACTKSSTPLQLVRRKYRLKAGIKRDGMLQPTVTKFFVESLGGPLQTGSGITGRKRKNDCTVLQNGGRAKQQNMRSQEGHSQF